VKRLLLSMTFLGLGATALPAFAQTTTGEMAVTAMVTSSCTIVAADMAFPAYSQTEAAETSALVTVQCTGTSGALGFTVGDGMNFEASRRLVSGANFLDYTVSVTAGAAAIASGTAVPVTVDVGDGSGSATLFGSSPTQGNKPAGDYTDTILLTLTY